MEIREIRDDEYEEFGYIGRQAFAQGSRAGVRTTPDPNDQPTCRLAVFDAGGMQARLAVIDYRVIFGAESLLPMGGIGGVACLPASRGKGYAGKLLTAALERMREQGQVISSLFPFSYAFYRNYGWDWVGLQRRYSLPSNILKAIPETENVRRAKRQDWPAIQECYARFSQGYRGMIARTPKSWEEELSDSDERFNYVYLYERNGETEGYMTLPWSSREDTRLSEMIARTPLAQAALLGLLARHAMQIKRFNWMAPGDDRLLFNVQANELEMALNRVTQGRIVDVAGAFAAWKPHSEARGSVNFAVKDERAPWNTGVWQAEFADGATQIQKTTQEPQVSLDIQALSQAFYGTPTLDELRAAHRLTVHDEIGYQALRSLLTGPTMWTVDGF